MKQDLSGLSIIVGDSIIQQSSKVRNLGIIFDQFLSFDDYISSVCRSIHFHPRNIGRIRHLLSQNATAQLIHALISIRLDFCNSILYNLPKKSILKLQRIQNQAARILTKTPRRDHITEVDIDLHWLRSEERIVYKLLISTFNAFIDRTAPLYLCELIEQQKRSIKTCTRLAYDAFLLKLPPPSHNCCDTFFIVPSLMNGTSLMNVSDGCLTLTCLSLKLRRCYFYVISTVSMTLVIIIRN